MAPVETEESSPSPGPPPPQPPSQQIDPRTGLPLQIGGFTTGPPTPPMTAAPAPPQPSPPVFPAPPRRTIAPPPVSKPPASPPSPADAGPTSPLSGEPVELATLSPPGGFGGGEGPASGAGAAALRSSPQISQLPPQILALLASMGFFSGGEHGPGSETPFGEDPRRGIFGSSPPPVA